MRIIKAVAGVIIMILRPGIIVVAIMLYQVSIPAVILLFMSYYIVTCCDKYENCVGNGIGYILDSIFKENSIKKNFELGKRLIFDDIPKVDLYFWLNKKIFGMNKNESIGQRSQRTILQALYESLPQLGLQIYMVIRLTYLVPDEID